MAKKAMVIILFTSFLFVGYYMVSNFPYEHIYFNQFVNNNEPEKLRKTFDLDYWGTSYQQGIEYILNSDTSSIINISFNPPPPRVDLLIFNPKDQHRINSIADINEADYLVTNYRDHPQDFPYSESKECYTIKVMNNRILSVFKLK